MCAGRMGTATILEGLANAVVHCVELLNVDLLQKIMYNISITSPYHYQNGFLSRERKHFSCIGGGDVEVLWISFGNERSGRASAR